MPTPTGMLKRSDRIYHKDHPNKIFVVLKRYGNGSDYSVTYTGDDGSDYPDYVRNQRWLLTADWQIRHNGWRIVV